MHVVAEKPLAIEREDLEKVRRALEKSGARLTMLLPMRYWPPFLALRQIVESGQIGEVAQIGAQKSYKVGARPAWMLRPQLWIDGEEFMACWTDYPGSNWGRLDHTNIVALTVPDGSHELVVKNMVFPPLWKRPFTPAIEGVLRK